MSKRRVFAIVAIAITAIWISFGPVMHEFAERKFQDSLTRALSASARRSSTLDLAQVADFQWDRVYIFGPYTPAARIEKTLGTRWTGATDIESGKGLNLIVFTKGNAIVNGFDVPRRIADFPSTDAGIALSREDANFKISQSDPNWIVLTCAVK